MKAARVIEAYYAPAKMNYETLGNGLPHLHTHIMPRHYDDPAPRGPLGFPNNKTPKQDEETFLEQVRALRALLDVK